MISFSKFLLQTEATFRQSKRVIHLFDAPMFSVFADNSLPEETITALKESSPKLKSYILSARTKIHQLGFPSMHANIVIKDLSKHVNQNTGGTSVGGWATRQGKYMALNLPYALEPEEYTLTVIIHEWAHLWMFNNSEGFKTAVREYYNKILDIGRTKIAPADVSSIRPQDRVLKPETSDMVWTYLVKGITTKIFKSIYLNRLMQKYPGSQDDYWLSTIPQDIKGYTQLVYDYIKELVEKCIPMLRIDSAIGYEKANYEAHISKIAMDAAKELTPLLIKRINKSIEDDVWDISEETGEEISELEEDSVQETLTLRTQNNTAFHMYEKNSYEDIHDAYNTVDSGLDVITMLHELIEHIYYHTKQKSHELSLKTTPNLSGNMWNSIRERVKNLVKWSSEYGLSNEDELWATGIEEFEQLPLEHRKNIIKLMSARGPRDREKALAAYESQK